MMRWPDCSASESTIAVPSPASRTVPVDDDLLAHPAHPAELDAERLELVGTAGGVGVGPRHLRHRPQPVQDPPRKPDALGELLVDVDRVEVARRARVAHGHVRIGRDLELDRVALAEGHEIPLTMLVQVPVQTVSPRWLVDTDSNT